MDKFYYPLNKSLSEWANHTLVLPAVSVGNVGQLATDLLINSLAFSKVGAILDDSFFPMIGNDPYSKSNKTCELMTACEVFENKDLKIICVQQRSPFIKGKRAQFVDKLNQWIKEMKFARTIILGSSHAYERTDEQLNGSQFRYLSTEKVTDGEIMDDLKKYEREMDGSLYLPGGGIMKPMIEKCDDLHVVCLLKFCMEGDNCQDAVQLASLLANWLKIGGVQWIMPPSWRYLYGNYVNKNMF